MSIFKRYFKPTYVLQSEMKFNCALKSYQLMVQSVYVRFIYQSIHYNQDQYDHQHESHYIECVSSVIIICTVLMIEWAVLVALPSVSAFTPLLLFILFAHHSFLLNVLLLCRFKALRYFTVQALRQFTGRLAH